MCVCVCIFIKHKSGYRYNKFCKMLRLKYGRIHPKAFAEILKYFLAMFMYVHQK